MRVCWVFRVDIRLEILPFERLKMITVRTGDVKALLRSGKVVARDAACLAEKRR
jgi:hypothetical protein